MDTPLISLILTCYNFGAYIDASISSLLNLKGGYSYEIIVIDDGSTDGSQQKIEQYSDAKIRYISHKQNKGVAFSINEAFSIAKGKYIGRFDADDVWLPHFLEKTVPILEQYADVGLVYGDVAFIDSQGKVLNPHSAVPDYNGWNKSSLFNALFRDYLICAPAILARKEAWALALPLPEHILYCDFELAVHIATQWEFKYLPEVLAQYRLHTQNMHSTAIRHRRAESSILDTIQRFQQKFPNILNTAEWANIYQQRYLQFGDQYFGTGDTQEARRCYCMGKVWLKFRTGYFRRWLATYLPMPWYNSLKKMIKGRA